MTRTQIATADFSCGGMQKGTNGDESDERLRTENSYINNRHKHTIIATLSVKKSSKFTDPDAQFPRGGALACARGYRFSEFRSLCKNEGSKKSIMSLEMMSEQQKQM